MNLHNGTNKNGLFDIQGQALLAIDTLNVARLTTIPAVVQDTIDRLNSVSPMPTSYESAGSGIPSALTSWQSSGTGLAQTLSQFCQSILAAFVAEESNQIDTSTPANLDYLINIMGPAWPTTPGPYYVTPNVVGGTLTVGSGNAGDTIVTWTLTGSRGVAQQNAYAETITMTVGENPSALTPSISCVGEGLVPFLSQDWPQGSGLNRSFIATNPSASMLTNGSFDTATIANVPDKWLITAGVPGTTILLTTPEVQTVTISGSPTGGGYILLYTGIDGNQRATPMIAFDATDSTVQAALRTIDELAGVSVTATGTSPNFVHSVTFTGVGGNVTQLTSVNLLTGGTPAITHGTTTGGDANEYRGVSIKLVGNSSVLHTLYQSLGTLKKETVYFCHLRARRSGTATGAVIKVAVVAQIGGAATTDDAGGANELVINAAAISTGASDSCWFAFRLPAATVLPVYLRIAATTAIPTGATIYIDDVAIAAGVELYAGGPYVAAFAGRTASKAGDSWTLAVTNTYAGRWQTWYNRIFNTMQNDILLPTTGTTLLSNDLLLYPA